MTQHTVNTRRKFKEIKSAVFEALEEIYEAEDRAYEEGNSGLGAKIGKRRQELYSDLIKIKKAENNFLLSEIAVNDAIDKLDEMILQTENATRRMKNLKTALDGTEDVIVVLARLLALFS